MKYLKQGRKVGIFFVAFVMIFWLSDEKAFSAPTTRDDCLTYFTKTAQCKNSCSGLTQVGTCSDDTSGNILCCDKVYKEGDKCGTNDNGVCREYKGTGKTCVSDETDIGVCNGNTTATLRCCMSSGSVPTDDSSCNKAGGVCVNNSGDADGGCSQNGKSVGTKIGTCDKKAGTTDPQNCCKSSASTSSSSSSGSGSLNYTPLENLPGFENQGGDFATYFGNLYKLALWIVGISALFMLVVGGFLYLSSAGNTSLLGTAKKTIYSALIGLVIALVSWLLLDTINSDLTNLKLSGLSGAISSGSSGGTGSTTITSPSGNADPEGCKKLKNLSVNSAQCNLASKELVAILSCMEGKGITNKWTSISASAVGGDQNAAIACCNNGHTAKCPHSSSTCHHGCTFGTKGLSYAVDIGGLTSSSSDEALCAVAQAAKSCGGGNIWGPRTLSCGITYQGGHNDHLHVSVSGCTH